MLTSERDSSSEAERSCRAKCAIVLESSFPFRYTWSLGLEAQPAGQFAEENS